MCGRGPSCSSSCCCRSCFSPFLRWKQIAKPARTMATEYLVRLRPNYEHPRGCLCCLLSDSRRDLFTTCSTEACIECRIRKCARQRLGLFVIPAKFPGESLHANSLSFLSRCLSLFLSCTLRPEVRRRDDSLRRRPTRRNLFTDLNGRNRGSQEKALFWLRSINRPAKLRERECCRAPETNNLMALLWKRIRSGVSSPAQAHRSRFRLSLRVGSNLRRLNEQRRNRRFCTRY